MIIIRSEVNTSPAQTVPGRKDIVYSSVPFLVMETCGVFVTSRNKHNNLPWQWWIKIQKLPKTHWLSLLCSEL